MARTKGSPAAPKPADKPKRKERPADPLLARVHVHEAQDGVRMLPPLKREVSPTDEARFLARGVRQIEFLERQRHQLGRQLASVYRELRLAGYDSEQIKATVKKRRVDPAKRERAEVAFRIYWDQVNAALAEIADEENEEAVA